MTAATERNLSAAQRMEAGSCSLVPAAAPQRARPLTDSAMRALDHVSDQETLRAPLLRLVEKLAQ